jgi:hypothetical protein
MKRGALTSSAFQNLFLSQTLGSSTNYAYLGLDYTSGFGNGCLVFEDFTSSVSRGLVKTNALFRDPSAWYHVILAFDTTNATAADRIRIYVNGVQQTLTITTQIAQNQNGYMNTGSAPHFIGSNNSNPSSNFFDGYLADINFIDGQALTPSSFGETDITTGVWKPKKYTGSYGTNGFYLNFSDNSAATAAAIGKDSSGNGNNFTPNNISLSAGSTYDSMIDTPTPYDDGGNGRGNYCVLNPNATVHSPIITNANLSWQSPATSSTFGLTHASIPMSSGKWYCEFSVTSVASTLAIGIANVNRPLDTSYLGRDAGQYSYHSNALKYNTDTAASYGATYAAGDLIGVAFDADAGSITFYKNNTSQGVAFSSIPSASYVFAVSDAVGGSTSQCSADINFGQRPFAYTPPSGFKALNTQNLPEPTIKKGSSWFNAVTYTGNGAARSITGVGFQPDLVWIKKRDTATNGSHDLFDAVRGATKFLNTDSTSAEATDAQSLTAFNSDGFSLGTNAFVNFNGNTFVGWNWKEGATPGFDVVAYSGPASPSVQSVAHNLGVKPDFMIVKARNLTGRNWAVYHKSLGATKCLRLNLTNAVATVSTYWNNTEPTSSVFTLGTDNDVNANGYNYVAYLWAEVPGFSKFGSYTGNGSTDGPFVYCGFRPRFILSKNANQSTGTLWQMHDTARDTYNYVSLNLSAHLSNAEYNYGTTICYDITANGFKVRGDDYSQNGSNNTHIFAAFAENPFKYALAR